MTDKALLLHWLAACSGPLLAAGAAQAQQAAPAQRPNILFILTDDQRWDAVGYVNPIVRTPHIDSLAREGVCFRNAFVTTPISAASRASLLTGMYERTHGYTFRQGPLKEPYMQQSYPACCVRAAIRPPISGSSASPIPLRSGSSTRPTSKTAAANSPTAAAISTRRSTAIRYT